MGRRVQFLVVLVAWAGKLSTITMLMIPSIPWYGAIQAVFNTISFCVCKNAFLWGEGPIYDVPDYLNRRPRLYGCTVMIINLFQCIILFVIPWSIFHFGVTMVTDMYLYGILLLTFVIGCPFAVSGMITLTSWLKLFGDGD